MIEANAMVARTAAKVRYENAATKRHNLAELLAAAQAECFGELALDWMSSDPSGISTMLRPEEPAVLPVKKNLLVSSALACALFMCVFTVVGMMAQYWPTETTPVVQTIISQVAMR